MNGTYSRQHLILPARSTESKRALPDLPARRLARLLPTSAVIPGTLPSPCDSDGALAGAHAPARV